MTMIIRGSFAFGQLARMALQHGSLVHFRDVFECRAQPTTHLVHPWSDGTMEERAMARGASHCGVASPRGIVRSA